MQFPSCFPKIFQTFFCSCSRNTKIKNVMFIHYTIAGTQIGNINAHTHSAEWHFHDVFTLMSCVFIIHRNVQRMAREREREIASGRRREKYINRIANDWPQPMQILNANLFMLTIYVRSNAYNQINNDFPSVDVVIIITIIAAAAAIIILL